MADVYYTKEHEWVRVDKSDADVITAGITNYAQDHLGDIVFVDLPDVGSKIAKGADIAVVESVKAASDIYAPVSGEVLSVNEQLEDSPELINSHPMSTGWMFSMRMSDVSELKGLLSPEEYKAYIAEL